MPTIKLGEARKNFMAAQEARRRQVRKGGAAGQSAAAAETPEADSKALREVRSTTATRRSISTPAARSAQERRKKCKAARKKLQAELSKRLAVEEERSRQKLSAFRAALAKHGPSRRPERRLIVDTVAGPEPNPALESMASATEVLATMRECWHANPFGARACHPRLMPLTDWPFFSRLSDGRAERWMACWLWAC